MVTVIWGLTTYGVKNGSNQQQQEATLIWWLKLSLLESQDDNLYQVKSNNWKVVETKIEIKDEEAPTTAEEMLLQNNDIALSAIHDALDERTFEQIKNIERAHETWKKLDESFEGTQAVKGANAYILKEKFASFKMKEDESVPDMFHQMEVLVNDLKALGEKIEDKDFSI